MQRLVAREFAPQAADLKERFRHCGLPTLGFDQPVPASNEPPAAVPAPVGVLVVKGGGVRGIAYAGAYQVLRAVAPFRRTIVPHLAGLVREGAFDGVYFRDWLAATLDGRDLNRRLIVWMTDPTRGRRVFDSAQVDVAQRKEEAIAAVRSSMTIPGFFSPSDNDRSVYDGGVLDNFPLLALVEYLGHAPTTVTRGAQPPILALALDLHASHKSVRARSRWFRWVRDLWAALFVQNEPEALLLFRDAIIDIETYPYSTIDFWLKPEQVRNLILRGRLAAWRYLEKHSCAVPASDVLRSDDILHLDIKEDLSKVSSAGLADALRKAETRDRIGSWPFRLRLIHLVGGGLGAAAALAVALAVITLGVVSYSRPAVADPGEPEPRWNPYRAEKRICVEPAAVPPVVTDDVCARFNSRRVPADADKRPFLAATYDSIENLNCRCERSRVGARCDGAVVADSPPSNEAQAACASFEGIPITFFTDVADSAYFSAEAQTQVRCSCQRLIDPK